MQIIKPLIVSFLIFSLNLNLSAQQINPFSPNYNNGNIPVHSNLLLPPQNSVNNASTINTKTKPNHIQPVTTNELTSLPITPSASKSFSDTALEAILKYPNTHTLNMITQVSTTPKADAFAKKLFLSPKLYVKWLKTLEGALRKDNVAQIMNVFLTQQKCGCNYKELIAAFQSAKAKHLVFWTGDYKTNLISTDGTGKKSTLLLDKRIKVKWNEVIGHSFKIDGRSVFNAVFKDYKLTWEYGNNLQPNDSKGSITFSDVILNGQFVGHQFIGTLTRNLITGEQTETFAGFSRIIASLKQDSNNNNNTGTGNNNTGTGTGNNNIGTGTGNNNTGTGNNNGTSNNNDGSIFGNNDDGSNDIDPLTGKFRMSIGFITYAAKKFGNQLWTTEDMRHYPDNVGIGFWDGFYANGREFKYYNWKAAMDGETKERAQGICANGWRIPTDKDWGTLEAFLGMSAAERYKNDTYRGTDQGTQLLVGGSSEFNARLVGNYMHHKVRHKGSSVGFISATSTKNHFNGRFIGPYKNTPVRFILFKHQIAKGTKSKGLNPDKLNISEIEVMAGNTNVARGAKVTITGGGKLAIGDATYLAGSTHISGSPRDIIIQSTVGDTFNLSYLNDGSFDWDYSYFSNKNNAKARGYDINDTTWIKIDLGAEYSIDQINLVPYTGMADTQSTAKNIVVFTSVADIDGSQAVELLRDDILVAQEIGVTNDQPSKQIIQVNRVIKGTPSAKTVWRGKVLKSTGFAVRCVKSITSDTSTSVTLKVGEPMTPVAFGDSLTSATHTWSIAPALDNGFQFDSATGIISGTPLAAKATVRYSIHLNGDSQAFSSINITVVALPILISSIQISGKNSINAGESVQLNAIISPSYASNKTLDWTIAGDQTKATISQQGKLTVLKSGGVIKVVASATDQSAVYATFDVSVVEDNTAFIFLNGKKYKEITSAATGKIWLDRNLGASAACSSLTDANCYGDLYQWGRGYDGHQMRDPSPVLSKEPVKANFLIVSNAKFIIDTDDWLTPGTDNSGAIRHTVLTTSTKIDICPTGFGVPSLKELTAEMHQSINGFNATAAVTVDTDANSPTSTNPYSDSTLPQLHFPLNGLRDKSGKLQSSGSKGYYWSLDIIKETVESIALTADPDPTSLDTAFGSPSSSLVINSDYTFTEAFKTRTIGMGIRCIKNTPPIIAPSVNDLTITASIAMTPITFTNMGRAVTKWEIAPALSNGLYFDLETGVISETAEGERPAMNYRITASNAFGSDTASVRITVDPIPIYIESLQIRYDKLFLQKHKGMQLHTIIAPSNADDDSVSWVSSDPSVAVVSDTGVVTALTSGKTRISVRANASRAGSVPASDSVVISVNEYYMNGRAYNTVLSPKTGRVWLDRNLGADRVCLSKTDLNCYGDFYQFGRPSDGHEKRNSATLNGGHSTSIAPTTHKFFTSTNSKNDATFDCYPWKIREYRNTYSRCGQHDNESIYSAFDWMWSLRDIDQSGQLRNRYWASTTDNICPTGFVVPTAQELANEEIESDIFQNFLKLSASGRRDRTGDFVKSGVDGYYWSRTPSNASKGNYRNFVFSGSDIWSREPTESVFYKSQYLALKKDQSGALKEEVHRNSGMNVRCIKSIPGISSGQLYYIRVASTKEWVSFTDNWIELYPPSNTYDKAPWKFIQATSSPDEYFLQNKWRCDVGFWGERRCDQWLSFQKSRASVDYDKVPWKVVYTNESKTHFTLRDQWKCNADNPSCGKWLVKSGVNLNRTTDKSAATIFEAVAW